MLRLGKRNARLPQKKSLKIFFLSASRQCRKGFRAKTFETQKKRGGGFFKKAQIKKKLTRDDSGRAKEQQRMMLTTTCDLVSDNQWVASSLRCSRTHTIDSNPYRLERHLPT
jgi:hypothetical protein